MTKSEMYFRNAMTDALREMEEHPDDSPVDIINEQLKSWNTGLKCTSDYVFEEWSW